MDISFKMDTYESCKNRYCNNFLYTKARQVNVSRFHSRGINLMVSLNYRMGHGRPRRFSHIFITVLKKIRNQTV